MAARLRIPAAGAATLRVEGAEVHLTNLDKPFWPDEGIAKGDLLRYYQQVAPVLVPHLKDRPFTMRRYPDGANGKAFFQKDAPKHMPEWIPRFSVEVSTRERPPRRRLIEAPLVNDERAAPRERQSGLGRPRERQRIGELPLEVEAADEREHFADRDPLPAA